MPWLLLRGLAREQRHWGTFPAFAADSLGEPVHTLDLPGTGTEHGRPSPWTVEGIVEDLRRRWLATRDAGTWKLLGVSLGGMVAMSWCSTHPEDFERVVLVNTSAGDLSAPWERMSPKVIASVPALLIERDVAAREARILQLTRNKLEDAAKLAEQSARYVAERPIARAAAVRQIRAAARFRVPDRIAIPVLILSSAGDGLTSSACSRKLAEHFAAAHEVHADAGHDLPADDPSWVVARIRSWMQPPRATSAASEPRVRSLDESGARPPVVVEPAKGGDGSVDRLAGWLGERRAWLDDMLARHGAVLLRGFDVRTAEDFQRIGLTVAPDLKKDYLGTAPRDALTEYVFSASELPPYYPIPQHCEMTFIRSPPRALLFCCLVAPSGPGGETPLADFQKVAQDLDPAVKERFATKGIKIIRNYSGPNGGGRFDLWKLKRWDEMFGTVDRAVVEQKCRDNGFEWTWRLGGGLRLTSTQPAFRAHPKTGQPVWFNHSQVFHLSAAPAEYGRILSRQPELRLLALRAFAGAAVAFKSVATPVEDQALHCTFGDDTPIPDADMDRVRDAIWSNLSVFRWARGDVLVIDNARVAHGRMPYRGPRQVVVSWA